MTRPIRPPVAGNDATEMMAQGFDAWMQLPSQCMATAAVMAAWQMEWMAQLGALGLSAFSPGGSGRAYERLSALANQTLAESAFLAGRSGGSPPFPE